MLPGLMGILPSLVLPNTMFATPELSVRLYTSSLSLAACSHAPGVLAMCNLLIRAQAYNMLPLL
jgi:hypothetical protein